MLENYPNLSFFEFESVDNKKRYANITFKIPTNENSNNFVKLDFYYVPSYEYSVKFLKILYDVYQKLSNRIWFEPHIVTFSSKSTEFIRNNCVSEGLYCAFDLISKEEITGRKIILESLR